MKNDPIVEGVRQTRQRIFTACDNDLEKLMDRYQCAENADQARIVSLETVRTQHNGRCGVGGGGCGGRWRRADQPNECRRYSLLFRLPLSNQCPCLVARFVPLVQFGL